MDESNRLKPWHQSHMFSSTAQVLQAYLDSSPLQSAIGNDHPTTWNLEDQSTMNVKLAGTGAPDVKLYFMPDSTRTTPRTSLSGISSPIGSPNSSHTTYSAVAQSPRKFVSPEIRRRRLAEGAQLRVKNLALAKSNGSTNLQPPIANLAQATASTTSNYSKSAITGSPDYLPPVRAAKLVSQQQIDRKPVQPSQSKHQNPSSLISVDMAFTNAGVTHNQSQSFSPNLVQITNPQRSEIPPRTTSLIKTVQPVVGIRPQPSHKKHSSIASMDKELPPEPFIGRTAPTAQKDMLPRVMDMTISSQKAVDQETIYPLLKTESAAHPLKPPVRGLPAGSRGLPSKPKLGSSFNATSRQLEQISIDVSSMTMQDKSKALETHPRGPTLSSLRLGPKPASKHQIDTSVSSLTSATVSGPITPQPFGDYTSPIAENAGRKDSRSQSKDGLIAMITEPQKFIEMSQLTQTQALTRSNSSATSRSSTPQSQKSTSTAATSISYLPGVPEIRTPLLAPEIKDSHLSCYSQHRPLVASSNHQSPILCMTCKADAELMWGCGWCHLRICSGCKDALVEVRNDLRRMLDESKNGLLIIGKERIPNPPYLNGNGPRFGSDTSSIRSYGSSESRVIPPHHMRSAEYEPNKSQFLRQQQSMDNLQFRGNGYRPLANRRGPPTMRNGPPDFIGMLPRQRQPSIPPRYEAGGLPQSPNMSNFGLVSTGYQSGQGSQTDYLRSRAPPNHHYQHSLYPPQAYMRSRTPPNMFQQRTPPQHHSRGPSPANTMRRPVPGAQRMHQQHSRFPDDDDAIPSALDLSVDAGAGPMASGLKALNFRGGNRPYADIDMAGMGGGAYPSMRGGQRVMT